MTDDRWWFPPPTILAPRKMGMAVKSPCCDGPDRRRRTGETHETNRRTIVGPGSPGQGDKGTRGQWDEARDRNQTTEGGKRHT